jgi:Txe/YoeB family toxin of Txe-Axe toxin-antitoxin module
MNNRILTLLTVSAGVILLTQSFQANALIKCKDKDGNWHFGDTLPPECAQEGYQELNKQGMVVDETERAKTDEEIAEQERLAEIEAEKRRIEEEAARRDKILLDTFSNVDDINMARDGKFAALETAIALAQKRNEKLQSDMDKLIEQAAAAERAGKPPAENLETDIQKLKRRINNNNEFITEKRKEQDAVKVEAEQDVARFKELKGIE